MTISPGGGPAWGHLGDALIQRRIELHYRTRRAFCDARQIDYRVAFDIEKAKRGNFGRATLVDIARAYAVTPESMERTLRGGDLEPVAAPASRPEPSGRFQLTPATGSGQFTLSRERDTAPPSGPPMGPIMQSVRADIAEALARAGIRGHDIFVAEDEAQLWDATDRLHFDERVEVVTHLRRIHLEEEEPGNPGHLLPRRAG